MSRESLPWRHRASDVLSQLGESSDASLWAYWSCSLLLSPCAMWSQLSEDFRSDPPMDCSDWSPGKMAESPHDLACEAQWDDQLNELNPQPRVRYRGRRRSPVSYLPRRNGRA
jgi:hypothetical protein